jgi:FkbM family methyltransferase
VRSSLRLAELVRVARLYRNWIEVWRKAGAGLERVVLRNGTEFRAPLPNDLPFVTDDVYGKHVYTPPGFELQPDDVVVDVGANIGVFSIYAAQRGARVHAIEPTRPDVQALERNLARSGVETVTTYETALADTEGVVKLFLTGTNGSNVLFDHGIAGVYDEYVEVRSTTLSSFLDRHGIATVDFLKLDCEGAQGLILPSAPLERIERIAIEFHDNVSQLSHEEIAAQLRQAGFTVWVESNSTPFGYVSAKRQSSAPNDADVIGGP